MLAKPPNIRHTSDLKALFHISTVILGPYVGQANVTCTVDTIVAMYNQKMYFTSKVIRDGRL